MEEIGLKIQIDGDEARESLESIDKQLEKMSAQAQRTVTAMGQQFAAATGKVTGMEAAFKKYQTVYKAFDEFKKGTRSVEGFNAAAKGTGIVLEDSKESIENAERAISAYGEGAMEGINRYQDALHDMLPALWAVEANSQIDGSISGDASALIEAIMAAIGWIDTLKKDASAAGISLNSGGKSGGGGGKKTSWYKEQIKEMEHLKALNRLSCEEEIAYLERIAAMRGRLNKDEARELEERLYEAREERRKADIQRDYDAIDHKKALGQLTLEAEVQALERILAAHQLNGEELLQIEEKLYAAREALRQKRVQDAYDTIAHEKAMNRMSLEEELAALNAILAAGELNDGELRDLKERLFQTEEDIRLKNMAADYAQLAHDKAMGRLSYQEELERLDMIRAAHRMTADEQRQIEEELYAAREALRQETLRLSYEAIDHKKRMGQLSLEEERRLLGDIKALRELNAQELLQITEQLYQNESAMRDRDARSLNTLLSGTQKALSERYKAMQAEETALLTASKENWSDWAKENTAEIDKQIAALDALLANATADSADEKELKKLAALELAIQYEQDAFNRAQLQNQLEAEQIKRQERLYRAELQAEKDALLLEKSAVSAEADSERDALDEQLKALKANYEKRLDALSLEAEAEKLLMEGSREAILDLLAAYNPSYSQAGASLGEALLQGFTDTVGSVVDWIDALGAKMLEKQQQLKALALAGTEDFYAGKAGEAVTINQQIHFNQPVESPYETAQRIRHVNEELAREIGR